MDRLLWRVQYTSRPLTCFLLLHSLVLLKGPALSVVMRISCMASSCMILSVCCHGMHCLHGCMDGARPPPTLPRCTPVPPHACIAQTVQACTRTLRPICMLLLTAPLHACIHCARPPPTPPRCTPVCPSRTHASLLSCKYVLFASQLLLALATTAPPPPWTGRLVTKNCNYGYAPSPYSVYPTPLEASYLYDPKC